MERASFCFPDSVFEPEDVGDASELRRLCDLADEAALDPLDDYVEAHVHGSVRFETDVEAVVLDSCYVDTDVMAAAERLGCRIELHPGFRSPPDAFDPAYRGGDVVELARSLGDELTPRVLGDALRRGQHEPQAIKRVWHCLARFGRR